MNENDEAAQEFLSLVDHYRGNRPPDNSSDSAYWKFVVESLSQGTPLSIVRLAEGEAKALPLLGLFPPAEQLRKWPSSVQAYVTQVSTTKWRNWFGTSTTRHEILTEIGELFERAVAEATVVGIRRASVLNQRRLRSLASAQEDVVSPLAYEYLLDGWLKEIRSDRETPIEWDIFVKWNKAGTLASIMSAAERLTVISGYSDVVPFLESRLKRKVDFIEIPCEHKPGVPNHLRRKYRAGLHIDMFPDIASELRNRCEPGHLFLVAGGLLGKIYTNIAAEGGAVGLDLGAVVDGWLGLETRPRLRSGSHDLEAKEHRF